MQLRYCCNSAHCASVHSSPLLLFAWPYLFPLLIMIVAHFHSQTPSQLVTRQAHPYSMPQPAVQNDVLVYKCNWGRWRQYKGQCTVQSSKVQRTGIAKPIRGQNEDTLGLDHTPKTPTSTQNPKSRVWCVSTAHFTLRRCPPWSPSHPSGPSQRSRQRSPHRAPAGRGGRRRQQQSETHRVRSCQVSTGGTYRAQRQPGRLDIWPAVAESAAGDPITSETQDSWQMAG